MKFGIRKPNYKARFKARTTGKLKRKLKRAVNPFYGKKGVGFIKNPGKSIKSAIYHRTTVGVPDVFTFSSGSKSSGGRHAAKRSRASIPAPPQQPRIPYAQPIGNPYANPAPKTPTPPYSQNAPSGAPNPYSQSPSSPYQSPYIQAPYPHPQKSTSIEKKLLPLWIILGIIALGVFSNLIFSKPSKPSREERSALISSSQDATPQEPLTDITGLDFYTFVEPSYELDVGEHERSYFKVRGTRDFAISDLEFISTNENVATFTFDHIALTTYVYFDIEAISPGQTTIYAQTADGLVQTEKITVTVVGDPTPTPTLTPTDTPQPTFTPEPTATPEPEPTAEPAAATGQAEEPESQGEMVWVTEYGSKYHSIPDCGSSSHVTQITLERAIARGIEPCSKCW